MACLKQLVLLLKFVLFIKIYHVIYNVWRLLSCYPLWDYKKAARSFSASKKSMFQSQLLNIWSSFDHQNIAWMKHTNQTIYKYIAYKDVLVFHYHNSEYYIKAHTGIIWRLQRNGIKIHDGGSSFWGGSNSLDVRGWGGGRV